LRKSVDKKECSGHRRKCKTDEREKERKPVWRDKQLEEWDFIIRAQELPLASRCDANHTPVHETASNANENVLLE
jgi:hypothetical protein